MLTFIHGEPGAVKSRAYVFSRFPGEGVIYWVAIWLREEQIQYHVLYKSPDSKYTATESQTIAQIYNGKIPESGGLEKVGSMAIANDCDLIDAGTAILESEVGSRINDAILEYVAAWAERPKER